MHDPAEYVRAWRERRGLSVTDLAELLRVSVGTVHTWEAGVHVPRPARLARMEAADRGELAVARQGLWRFVRAEEVTGLVAHGVDVRSHRVTPAVTVAVTGGVTPVTDWAAVVAGLSSDDVERLISALAARGCGDSEGEDLSYHTASASVGTVVTLSIQPGRRNNRNTQRQRLFAEVPDGTADILRAACHRAGITLAELLRAVAAEIDSGRIAVGSDE